MTRALDEFRLETGVYRLGQFNPVSIRDQVIRANYLVEHLAASPELAVSTRLLVIGAGAAGLTAAATASRLGVQDVTMVEEAGGVMPLQGRSDSRWLDPVQYDWPAAHWAQESWPLPEDPRRFTAVAVPFPKLDAAIAEDWATEFQNRTSRIIGAGVRALFHKRASMWRRTSNGFDVDLVDVKTKTPTTVTADLLIVAVGFGLERATIRDDTKATGLFKSLDFWSSDKFQQPDMGMPGATKGVLVSGAGDGALQDFVRLSTGAKSARDVLHGIWGHTNPRAVWKEHFASLWHWEDHANRARNFVPGPLPECDVLRRLHQRHVEAVKALAASSDWPDVLRWLDSMTKQRRLGAVELAFKCDHFGWCYPLNRTVALLTARYMKERGFEVLRSHSALQSTIPVGHPCSSNCWGEAHEADLAQGVSCEHSDDDLAKWPAVKTHTIEVEGLVIRHGIDPMAYGPRVFDRLKPQAVPFHLP